MSDAQIRANALYWEDEDTEEGTAQPVCHAACVHFD